VSLLDDEIAEQPSALAHFLDTEIPTAARFQPLLRDPELRYVVVAARGSSDNAARYAQYVFGARLRLPVALAVPSVISVYERPPRLDGALVVGVSQSGRSPDIVAVLQSASDQGRPSIAVTNEPNSPLAAAATEVLPLHIGAERSVAATKTYLCSLAALALLCTCGQEGEDARRAEASLRDLPPIVDAVIRQAVSEGDIASRFRDIEHCVILARGFNYGTAYEIALKIKELSGVIAEPYSPPDLLHGPIAAIDRGFPVMVVAPDDATLDGLREISKTLSKRGAELIAITADTALQKIAGSVFTLPAQPRDWLTPMVTVVPGQVFAANLARARGADPDHPVGLTKVTETF
jgi:glucosamine--fructose-6-phosphate aminotransferase (isomerizing)